MRKGHDTGSSPHTLEHAVDAPQHKEHPVGITEAKDDVDDCGTKKSDGNNFLDVTVVGNKSIRAFSDGDGDHHRRAHRTEFGRGKSRLDHRLFRNTKRHAHHIVHTVAEDHCRNGLHACRMIHLLDGVRVLNTGLVRIRQKPFEHVQHLPLLLSKIQQQK